MDDITMEKKLRMVQQIRSQYHQNRYDLSNREQILYGRTSERSYADYSEPLSDTTVQEDALPHGSFRLRAALAGILFMAVIVFDRLGLNPAGVEMKNVFQVIAEDYRENVDAFVSTLSSENILK